MANKPESKPESELDFKLSDLSVATQSQIQRMKQFEDYIAAKFPESTGVDLMITGYFHEAKDGTRYYTYKQIGGDKFFTINMS
jgi:hypothetical protein